VREQRKRALRVEKRKQVQAHTALKSQALGKNVFRASIDFHANLAAIAQTDG
jgi:hypothetical protein